MNRSISPTIQTPRANDSSLQTESSLSEIKSQVKMVLRRLNRNSEPQASIESGQYTLQYVSYLFLMSASRYRALWKEVSMKVARICTKYCAFLQYKEFRSQCVWQSLLCLPST